MATVATASRKARAAAMARQRMEAADEAGSPAASPTAADRPAGLTRSQRYRVLPWLVGLTAACVLLLRAAAGRCAFVVAVALIVGLIGRSIRGLPRRPAHRADRDPVGRRHRPYGRRLGRGRGRSRGPDQRRERVAPPLAPAIGRCDRPHPPGRQSSRGLSQPRPARAAGDFSAVRVGAVGPLGDRRKPGADPGGRRPHDPRPHRDRPPHPFQRHAIANVDVGRAGADVLYRLGNVADESRQLAKFLATTIGRWGVAGTIVLQAVGMAWMSWLSRMRF